MDPRSNVLQKSIYQAIFNVWGAENSFINTEMAISQRCLYLIQSNDSRDFEHPRVHFNRCCTDWLSS